jgi:prepilin signal peptidase PulO-like enzyme (type II secretory pathway)
LHPLNKKVKFMKDSIDFGSMEIPKLFRKLLIPTVLGMFAVSVPMACLLFFVPGSFGGGDIKFVAAVGVAIGVKLVVMGSAAAILLAGIYCIRLLAEKRNGQKTAFAFGPFLCMGMTAAMVFGDAWAAWFLSG